MTKRELITHLNKCRGWVPYARLYDIYKDDDVIPERLVAMACKCHPAPGAHLVTNSHLAKLLDTAING